MTYLGGGHPRHPQPEIRCTFCGEGLSEVKGVAALHVGLAICDGCVQLCVELIAEADREVSHDAATLGMDTAAGTSQGGETASPVQLASYRGRAEAGGHDTAS